MKFICLVYAEPDALSGLSPTEKSKLDRDSRAYDQELEASGRFIAASAQPAVSSSCWP